MTPLRTAPVLLATLAAAACSRPPAVPASAATVHAEVLQAPEVATIGDHAVMAYEVLVRNASDEDVEVASLTVRALGFAEAALTGDALRGRTRLLLEGDASQVGDLVRWKAGQQLAMSDGEIPPHRSAAVFLWLTAAPGTAAPASVHHEVGLEAGGRAMTLPVDTTPKTESPLVLGPPLRGGAWLFTNGPADADGHTRTLVPIHGRPWGGQRFASDLLRLGPDGRPLPEGADAADSARFYGYGADVLAVADATVARAKDGVAENRGGERAVAMTLENLPGNTVSLDLGDGRYAFYAHLQPGSLRVKAGDRVKKGDVIGKLGHSGNSTAPHLHFHVCTAPAGLECEGVPYAFDRFEAAPAAVTGEQDNEMKFSARAARPPAVVTASLPSGGTLVTFPR